MYYICNMYIIYKIPERFSPPPPLSLWLKASSSLSDVTIATYLEMTLSRTDHSFQICHHVCLSQLPQGVIYDR